MIYTNDILDKLQISINNGYYTISSFNSIDELPKQIYLSGIKLKLLNENGKHTSLNIQDYGLLSDSVIEWKKSPVRRFYVTDWKKYTDDLYKDNYKKYKEITITINEIVTKVLVRQIDLEEFETEDEYNMFCDLVIDDTSYAIIKIYIENNDESYSIKSIVEEEAQKWLFCEERIKTWNDLDAYESDTIEEDNIDLSSIAYESEELF